MSTTQSVEGADALVVRRASRGRGVALVAGLVLLLFGAWFAVMSEDTRVRGMVSTKTASFLQVALHTVAFYVAPLPDGRRPRVEVRDPGRPPYYVADFNNVSPGLAYAVEKETCAGRFGHPSSSLIAQCFDHDQQLSHVITAHASRSSSRRKGEERGRITWHGRSV